MITVLKVQLPVNKSNPFAIFFNNDQSIIDFIKIDENKELMNQLMGESKTISYCKCEVNNGRITEVLQHVTEKDFLEEK